MLYGRGVGVVVRAELELGGAPGVFKPLLHELLDGIENVEDVPFVECLQRIVMRLQEPELHGAVVFNGLRTACQPTVTFVSLQVHGVHRDVAPSVHLDDLVHLVELQHQGRPGLPVHVIGDDPSEPAIPFHGFANRQSYLFASHCHCVCRSPT